jgi:MFS transporter, PPP family, 3-phenylpropionic acid transporter
MNVNDKVKQSSYIFFLYFGIFGILVPFTGLYLKGLGFNESMVGIVLGGCISGRIFGPFLFSQLYHKLPLNSLANILGVCLLVFSALLFFSTNKIVIFASLFFINFFWMALLPNIETMVLMPLSGNMKKYGYIRMVGSFGFIIVSLGLGFVLTDIDVNYFSLVLLAMSVLLCFSLWVTRHEYHSDFKTKISDKSSLGGLFNRKWVVFFAIFTLFEVTHAPYYSYFTIYMANLGHSGTTIGLLIVFSVLVEILAFRLMGKWVDLFNPYLLLSICTFLTVVRWLMLDFYQNSLAIITLSQVLHAASFAVPHLIGQKLMCEESTESSLASRQTIYTIMTLGVGASLGALLAGFFWNNDGSGISSFVIVGCSSAVAACLMSFFYYYIRAPKMSQTRLNPL